jgi:hypothetical protein
VGSPDTAAVVVVTAADTPAGAAQARALDGSVRAVVLCGDDAGALGALADELTVRAVSFVGDPAGHRDKAALVELVDELFARD